MNVLRKLLLPFVPIYYFVTWCRNTLYNWGVFKSIFYDFPVICIGNLSVGGTGKTPMVEYVIRQLQERKNIAVLSRGYKRKTKGFLLANAQHTASDLGDEPFQIFSKFKNITVAVDGNRREGIAQLKQRNPKPEVIILDDAFQHRKVQAGLNILLTAYDDLFYNDILLPTGNLREPISGKKRAQIIVVTKCPKQLSQKEKSAIINKISPLDHQSIFFSHIKYAEKMYNHKGGQDLSVLNHFTLVTGIAKPKPLINFLKSLGYRFEHLQYNDHHEFSKEELNELTQKKQILTTEKDFVRLKKEERLKEKLFYLPIEIDINEPREFNNLIHKFVNN